MVAQTFKISPQEEEAGGSLCGPDHSGIYIETISTKQKQKQNKNRVVLTKGLTLFHNPLRESINILNFQMSKQAQVISYTAHPEPTLEPTAAVRALAPLSASMVLGLQICTVCPAGLLNVYYSRLLL